MCIHRNCLGDSDIIMRIFLIILLFPVYCFSQDAKTIVVHGDTLWYKNLTLNDSLQLTRTNNIVQSFTNKTFSTGCAWNGNSIADAYINGVAGLAFGTHKEKKKPIGNSIWSWGVSRPTDGTTFTVSADRNSRVYYTISISCTATIGGAASGTVKLQASLDGGTTWNDAPTIGNSNTVTLALVLNSVDISTSTIMFELPAGALCKFITTISGTTTVTWVNGVEVTYDN